MRAFAHGMSAACGKSGAIISALVFNTLTDTIGTPNVLWSAYFILIINYTSFVCALVFSTLFAHRYPLVDEIPFPPPDSLSSFRLHPSTTPLLINTPLFTTVFFACCIAGAVATLLLLPEVKGRDPDLIDAEEIRAEREARKGAY